MHINAIDNSIRRSFAFFSTFIVCMEWQRNVLSELGLHIGLPFLQANTKTSLVTYSLYFVSFQCFSHAAISVLTAIALVPQPIRRVTVEHLMDGDASTLTLWHIVVVSL